MFGNSRGSSRISALIYLFVTILVFYAIVKTIPVYLRYYSMDDEVYHQVSMSKINNADTIKNDLIDKARELDIPIEPEDIQLIYGDNERLRIVMSWEETVDYGYDIMKTYEFSIDTSARNTEENQ